MPTTHKPGTRISATSAVTCKRCGARDLAWAKSTRTGRSYLCQTMRSQSETRELLVTMPWQPHDCAAHVAKRDENLEAVQAQLRTARYCQMLRGLQAAAREGLITTDQLVACSILLGDMLDAMTAQTA